MSVSRLRKRKGEALGCVLGLAAGWALAAGAAWGESAQASEPRVAAETGEVSLEQAAPPDYESPEVQEEIFIHELANEFHIDQDIVRVVHRHSKEWVDPEQPEWRLLRSPEAVTYLMLSVIHAESRGNPEAIGDNGRARGLTQIHTPTARAYGEVTAQDLLDPETNIRYSFIHFHALLKRYKGNFPLALYGWNRGIGTVDRLLRYGKSPANHYGRTVYRAAQERRQEAILMGQ